MTVTNQTAHISEDEGLMIPVVGSSDNVQYPSLKEIRSSPYQEAVHRLQLENLEEPYRILAVALQSLQPLNTESYAFDNYETVFNIEEIRLLIQKYSQQAGYSFPETTGYVIAFRSQLTEDSKISIEKRTALAHIDEASHIEANESGGLLKYWYGVPDGVHGRNLATCYWRSKADAKKGGGGPAHRTGMTTAKAWYALYEVLEFQLDISPLAESMSLKQIGRVAFK